MSDLLTLLSEWDERREKATAGPWVRYLHGKIGKKTLSPTLLRISESECQFDADFIAAARTEHERLSKALRNAVVFLNTLIEFKSQYPHNYPLLLEVKSLALDHLTDIETILNGEV